MNKPHIKKHLSMTDAFANRPAGWACFTRTPGMIGWQGPWCIGRTPFEAYETWRRINGVRASHRGQS